jgi:hypothetical protein
MSSRVEITAALMMGSSPLHVSLLRLNLIQRPIDLVDGFRSCRRALRRQPSRTPDP